MRKLIFAVCLFLGSASGWAATQYHAIGSVQMSTSTINGGFGLWQVSAAAELLLTANTTGQLIFCKDCSGAGTGLGVVCVSTGSTTANQFVIVGSSLTTVKVCQ